MQIINLNAEKWSTKKDYSDALKEALGAPKEHGTSIDAFIDSMIWGGMNKVEAPYTVKIQNTKKLPIDVVREIELLSQYLLISRAEFRDQEGHDVEVSVEVNP